jgi:hypothetical protein
MQNDQYKAGQDEMRERICALVAHHMETARLFHGKGSEEYLRYRNLLEEVRIDQQSEQAVVAEAAQ